MVPSGVDVAERTEGIRQVLMANGGYSREFTHVLSGAEATTPNVSKVLRVIQSTRPEFAAGTGKLLLVLLTEVRVCLRRNFPTSQQLLSLLLPFFVLAVCLLLLLLFLPFAVDVFVAFCR